MREDTNPAAHFTHPDHAALVDPLFAARKEGKKRRKGSPPSLRSREGAGGESTSSPCYFTHPDYSSLVDPLFAARKEGEATKSKNSPLCEAERG
ncbi:hypothetical protein D0C36_17770 [Mucilaginibacter conchicola]|uniref:Uncharacterized protein n=1 Tax=Mucilaginibacter conchicola TaxID=2303333 RepID=A0A372NPF3_9SPHI|nr:hypothetical protein D0C36_17770 [Mucilaginibacter conchicola]